MGQIILPSTDQPKYLQEVKAETKYSKYSMPHPATDKKTSLRRH